MLKIKVVFYQSWNKLYYNVFLTVYLKRRMYGDSNNNDMISEASNEIENIPIEEIIWKINNIYLPLK